MFSSFCYHIPVLLYVYIARNMKIYIMRFYFFRYKISIFWI